MSQNRHQRIKPGSQRVLVVSLVVLFAAVTVPPVFAQTSTDYHKTEVAVAYSHMRAESTVGTQVIPTPGGPLTLNPCTNDGATFFGANFQKFFCDRRGFNGFDASVAYNFHRYVGLKGNVSAHFNSAKFTDGATNRDTRARVYDFLAGVQLKDNRKEGRAVRPFAHVLLGVARVKLYARQTNQFAPPPFNDFTISDSQNDFAMKLGGGLDVRLGRRVDLRIIEVNYNPIFGGERALVGGPFPATPQVAKGRTAHNFTIGFGIVLH